MTCSPKADAPTMGVGSGDGKGRRTKGKRHSEEQTIAILKQSEAGMKAAEVCRQAGISEETFNGGKRSTEGLKPPTPSGCGISRKRAGGSTRLLNLARGTTRCRPRCRAEETKLRKRLREPAAEPPCFGYRLLGRFRGEKGYA